MAASYCLRAFSDTRFPFLAMCLAYWVITLPLAWWFGLRVADTPGEGTAAIWASLIVGICLCALLVSWRLWRTLRRPLAEVSCAPEEQSSQGNPAVG